MSNQSLASLESTDNAKVQADILGMLANNSGVAVP